jgi:3-hydroxyisobutyrate dehydrogenase-like beta-hydroxyacid dehydrogenase
MKLVTNAVLGLNRAALAEGLAFAKALGLDLQETLSVLRETPAYSRAVDVKGAKMINQNFEPEARLSQHLKDVRLMIAAAKRAGMKLPLTETHENLLKKAEAGGLGELDNSAIIRIFESFQAKP